MDRIVVTRRLPDDGLAPLGGDVWVSPHPRPLRREELLGAVAGARALVTLLYDRVDAELLDAAGPQLAVVANVAVGYDNIDLEACRARGVAVTNTPGVLTDATADLAIALLLAVTRRLGEGERLVRSGRSWRWDVDLLLGTGLRGATLGIVGLGAIGQAVARRARAFGMDVVCAQRSAADPALLAELDARQVALDQLFDRADVVSLHCPLTPQTRHLVDARRLERLGAGGVLVNTARGPVVDEAALVDALRDGVIAGAGLDVFEAEPELSSGLRERENAVLLPHLGSATVATRTAMARLACENVAAVLAGRPPLTPVE